MAYSDEGNLVCGLHQRNQVTAESQQQVTEVVVNAPDQSLWPDVHVMTRSCQTTLHRSLTARQPKAIVH